MDRRHLIAAGAALPFGLSAVAAARAGAAPAPDEAEGAVQVAQTTSARATPTIYDYGAVGDGVTDDSAAFSKALAAAATKGLMVIVPAGTYAIAKTISFVSTQDAGKPWGLQAQGATLVSTITNGTDIMSLQAVNTVRYFRILGAMKILGSGKDGNGLRIIAYGSSYFFYNVTLDGLCIEGAGLNGLLFEGNVFESLLVGCFFQDCKQNGAVFAQSKGGVCSAITVVGCFFAQNTKCGMMATNFDSTYGGTTDVRIFGGYCRDNGSYGFYYNNGTSSGAAIEQVGFENNCRSLSPGDPNGAHVYGLVQMRLRNCTGYNEGGGATYMVRGWFSNLTVLDNCDQSSGGAMATTGKSRLAQVNGNAAGHVLMRQSGGGFDMVSGTGCTWAAENCYGTSPVGTLNLKTTVTSG